MRGCQRGKARAAATRVRGTYRNLRHHPKASEDFVIYFLILPSSFFLETQRVCGAELSELLIKHGFGVTTGGLM